MTAPDAFAILPAVANSLPDAGRKDVRGIRFDQAHARRREQDHREVQVADFGRVIDLDAVRGCGLRLNRAALRGIEYAKRGDTG